MQPPSYIGCSGITTRAEVLGALSAFPDCGRQLMVGVLASEKTLAGQKNRYHRRCPPVERIAGIFVEDPRCLNLVHFGADEPPDATDLARLFDLAGPLCHGFQFNGAWPWPANIETLCRMFEHAGKKPRIVLQARFGTTAAQVGLYVTRGVATDVLIDASGGTGKPLDAGHASFWFMQFRSMFPSLGIGVAGGLCAEMVPQVADLLRAGVSVDAESGLRDGADGGGRLDMEKVQAWLKAAGEVVMG
jgi:hypothetical protein